jgi:hypothetical protein
MSLGYLAVNSGHSDLRAIVTIQQTVLCILQGTTPKFCFPPSHLLTEIRHFVGQLSNRHQRSLLKMEVETSHYFEWLDPAFVTPNSVSVNQQHEGWHACQSSQEQTLTISPSLLNQRSLEESDQFRHDVEVFPTDLFRDFVRGSFTPVEQLRTEALWSGQQPDGFQKLRKSSLAHPYAQQPYSKPLHASEKSPCSPVEADTSALQPVSNAEPLKRRRGRPRLRLPEIGVGNSGSGLANVSGARESHLEKNRIAAEKCRQRKRKHDAEITADALVLSAKNRALKVEETDLREQVLNLKNEVLRHARCGSQTIDKYIAQSAGGQFGREAPFIPRRDSSQTQGSTVSTDLTDIAIGNMTESLPSRESSNSSVDSDGHVDVFLLNDLKS